MMSSISFLCNFKVFFEKGLLKLFKFDGRRYLVTSSSTISSSIITNNSSSTTTDNDINFTVSYLINSCGLPEHKALSVSKKIQLKTSSQPDSVLTLLRNYGFTDTQISKLVLYRPIVLLADPSKTLKPKIEFFHSIGFCGTQLTHALSWNPSILFRSLNNHIIPSIDFLKTLVHTDTIVFKVLKDFPWLLDKDLQIHLAPKVALLQAHGVPNSNILSLLTFQPRSVVQASADRFDEVVKQVREIGFNPLKITFVYAIWALLSRSKSGWEGKLDVYRRCGWSEEDIRVAFMKQPHCMTKSEKKIMDTMDVLVNKMGYDPSLIARNSIVLNFSLEKRILPRCSVLQVLIAKGLVKKDQNLSTAFQSSEKYFLNKYVTTFESKVPQLLNVYLGKVNALELLG